MSELDELIEATKQGNLERVRAILGADDKLADQGDESGATPGQYPRVTENSSCLHFKSDLAAATKRGWAVGKHRWAIVRYRTDA